MCRRARAMAEQCTYVYAYRICVEIRHAGAQEAFKRQAPCLAG